MDGLLNVIWQTIQALVIYGALTLTYAGLGAYKNITLLDAKFDWKTYAKGVTKYLALGLGIVVIVASSYAVIHLAPGWGIQLDNAQQISTKVIFGIITAGIVTILIKNIQQLVQIFGSDPALLQKLQAQALKVADDKPIILDVGDFPGQTKAAHDELVEQGIAGRVNEGDGLDKVKAAVLDYLAEIGGRGAVVPTDSPDAFRNAVINNSYNVDGVWGAQCWDGAALFWLNAVGRTFSTGGTGAARGGWEAARAANAGSEFEVITDRNAIRKGDWLVFGGSKWGHVGMSMSSNLGNYVRLLAQNQSGGNTDNGAPFSEINMSLNNFLGAFRLKRWNAAPAPAPQPAPQPAPAPAPAAPAYSANPDVKVGSNVTPTRAYSYEGVQLAAKVLERIYPVTEVKGDRAVLGNGLNTAFRTGDLRVVSNPEQAQPAPAPAAPTGGFSVGDTVVPTRLVDYDGTNLTQYDDTYTISEIKGDRAVLNARGQVWAAMNTANIRKA